MWLGVAMLGGLFVLGVLGGYALRVRARDSSTEARDEEPRGLHDEEDTDALIAMAIQAAERAARDEVEEASVEEGVMVESALVPPRAIDVLFGELRSLMQQPSPDPEALRALVLEAARADRARCVGEWSGYLDRHVAPVEARTVDELSLFAEVFPRAPLRLDVVYPPHGVRGEVWDALVDHPHAGRLRHVRLSGVGWATSDGASAFEVLARVQGAGHLAAVESLSLEGSTGLFVNVHRAERPMIAARLSQTPLCQHLRALNVRQVFTQPGLASAFLESEALRTIEALDLSENYLGDDSDAVEVVALSRVLGWPALRRLDLTMCYIGEAGAQVFLEADGACRLEHLDLSENNLGDAGIQRLASATLLGELRALVLYDNRITDHGAHALASAPWLPGLRTLKLNANRLGARGVRSLCAADLRVLEHLDLSGADLSGVEGLDGVRALRVARMPALRTLSLSDAGLDDEGLRMLLDDPTPTPLLARLDALDLSANRFTAPTLRALLASPHLATLRTLDLSYSTRHDDLAALCADATLPALRTLRLSGATTPDGLARLLASTTLPDGLVVEVYPDTYTLGDAPAVRV